MDSNVLVPVIVALVTAVCGVPTMTYLGQRFSTKTASTDALRKQEMDLQIAWRAEQAQSFTSLKQEHRALTEEFRAQAQRLDTTERRCAGVEDDLKEQTQKVEQLIRENEGLTSRVRTLEADLLKAYRENDVLKRGQP